MKKGLLSIPVVLSIVLIIVFLPFGIQPEARPSPADYYIMAPIKTEAPAIMARLDLFAYLLIYLAGLFTSIIWILGTTTLLETPADALSIRSAASPNSSFVKEDS